MLFALGQPVVFAGLLLAFLLALLLRAVAVRAAARVLGLAPNRDPIRPRPREDVDPFGAVAAALGGTGWGRTIEVDEVPRFRGRARAAATFLAGPVAALLAAQAAFAAYRIVFPASGTLSVASPSEVMRGLLDETVGGQFLLALGVGLLGFGLLALMPIPPLDGFGALWTAVRRPGAALTWMRQWFGEKNLGVAALLLFSLFPSGYPLLLVLIDAFGAPLMRIWA